MKDEKFTDEVIELCTNIDDMTPEALGFAMEMILESGALDVHYENIYMKKNRPAFKLCVLSTPEDEEKMAQEIFRYTTAIGIRRQIMKRYILCREIQTVETDYGKVRVKYSQGYHAQKFKLEYEDIARLAKENRIGIDDMRRHLERSIRDSQE
ncbi:MAG: DUF111 family protein [Peptostreptococcaceae bacterium]|nr:DUF111 family protein [Peptostreptococcaceae bacterium]